MHYIAYVQLTEDEIPKLAGMRLVPGMPAEVCVLTRERGGSFVSDEAVQRVARFS